MLNDPRVDKQIRDLPAKASAQIVWVINLFERNGFELTEVHLKKLQRKLRKHYKDWSNTYEKQVKTNTF